MKTHMYKIVADEHGVISEDELEKIRIAGRILAEGGLVAFPTETVYGLGGDGLNPKASAKIYEAKGRPSDNPLIVHIASLDALDVLARDIPQKAKQLAEAFWPGPLTMIFKKSGVVPDETTGHLDTVAVRFPSHPVARALIQASGTYIAAPSANTSGRPSPTTADHVFQDMDGRIDAIIDGGMVGIGIESTIVDVTDDVPMILRPGFITKAMLEEIVGAVTIDPAILDDRLMKDLKPKAPGMKYKHYAPKGDLTIVESGETKNQHRVVEKINELLEQKLKEGVRTAVIATDETRDAYHCDIVESIGTRTDEASIAHNLYDILRRMDELQVDEIYSESFSEGDLGQAIMNRLLKAAGHRVIYV